MHQKTTSNFRWSGDEDENSNNQILKWGFQLALSAIIDMVKTQLYSELVSLLGESSLITDLSLRKGYAEDWSTIPGHIPPLVVRPDTPHAVSKLIKFSQDRSLSLVTQGGRTSLCGGAIPQQDEIVLSLERLSSIININPVEMTMTVEAGATLQSVQEAANAKGLQFSLDLGARGSCTIGGNAATNAGGNRVIRYGVMRDLVLDLEAVLPNGDMIGGQNSMMKDNAGYDLKQLMIGTEGTLGVITTLTLKLHPKQDATTVSLCAADSLDSIITFLGILRKRSEGRLSAFEIMWDDFFEQALIVTDTSRRPFGERHAIYALIEFQGQDADTLKQMTETILMDVIEDGTISDVVIGQSLSDNDDMWAIRDSIAEMLTTLQPLIAFDVSISLLKTGEFVDKAEALVTAKYPGCNAITFGHLGDGNLHLTIYNAEETDLHAIESDILELVGEYNGSISGEHGIGMIKKPFLHHSKSAVEIGLMRTIKKAIDPKNILNPGRIIDAAP